jgi:predicted secreted Zn-dependent protease
MPACRFHEAVRAFPAAGRPPKKQRVCNVWDGIAPILALKQCAAMPPSWIRLLPVVPLAALLCAPAHAASVSKTYSYFTVGGTTLAEIERELVVRGPQVGVTGRRHPGATQMEFTSKLGYTDRAGRCEITKATVTVNAKVILPRWNKRGSADAETRLVWDTLSSDIKRHEESHIVIAKNHARELEDELKALGRFKTCQDAAAKAKKVTTRVLGKHDEEQARFDRIEGINFERRIQRLLEYRLQQGSEAKATD